MKLPGTSRGLRKLSGILDKLSISHMLIGGFALVAYGQMRTTQNVDMAIKVRPGTVCRTSRTIYHSTTEYIPHTSGTWGNYYRRLDVARTHP